MRKIPARWVSVMITVVELVLSFMFIQGGIKIFFAKPLFVPGIVQYLTNQTSIYVYGSLCVGVGLALLASKFWHLTKLHKHSLLGMFLISTYVVTLSIYVTGFEPGMIVSFLVIAATGALWLTWKMKTEYISKDMVRQLDRH